MYLCTATGCKKPRPTKKLFTERLPEQRKRHLSEGKSPWNRDGKLMRQTVTKLPRHGRGCTPRKKKK